MSRSEDPGFFETLYSARALRRFSERIVEEDVIFQVLDVAIRAPSGGNAQDWRFVVVKEQAKKKKMQEWAEEGWSSYQSKFAKNNDEARNLPRAQRLPFLAAAHLVEHLAEAPVIIVVTGEKGRHRASGGRRAGDRRREERPLLGRDHPEFRGHAAGVGVQDGKPQRQHHLRLWRVLQRLSAREDGA